jgi:hypothetical protein
MAENSKRERIILGVVALLEQLACIKTVVRTKQSYSQLQQFALTQLPVAAVVANLPIPKEKISSRRIGNVDTIISELTVRVLVYGQDNVNPDKQISLIADDVWNKLYSNQTLNGLVLGTLLTIEEDPEYWEPYYAFQITCKLNYQHDTGGI